DHLYPEFTSGGFGLRESGKRVMIGNSDGGKSDGCSLAHQLTRRVGPVRGRGMRMKIDKTRLHHDPPFSVAGSARSFPTAERDAGRTASAAWNISHKTRIPASARKLVLLPGKRYTRAYS